MRIIAAWLIIFVTSSCLGQSVITLLEPIRENKMIPSDDSRAVQVHTEIKALTEHLVERWNARDIEGFMKNAWKSDDFRVVMDGEATIGWANVLEAYQRGYADRNTMGTLICTDVRTS